MGSNLGGYDYGTTYSLYYTPDQEYKAVGSAIINSSACNDIPTAEIRRCLESVSAENLVNQENVARFIIKDGTYIVQDQLDVRNTSNTAFVPTMWGVMAEDGAPFLQYAQSGNNRQQAIESVLNGQQSGIAQEAINEETLFPLGYGNNETLSAFNLSAQIGTDVIFRCIDQATVYSSLKHEIFPEVYFYQFERAYQTPGFDPNSPTCDAQKTKEKPFGDPSLPYLRCHSGDLYFEFGTFNEFGLPFRDNNDLYFNRLIQDYWTSFIRSADPNPDVRYLSVRQYTDTLNTIMKSGKWLSVPRNSREGSVQLLDVFPRQATFQRQSQCNLEGLPGQCAESS